jgi:hypothetical protein
MVVLRETSHAEIADVDQAAAANGPRLYQTQRTEQRSPPMDVAQVAALRLFSQSA